MHLKDMPIAQSQPMSEINLIQKRTGCSISVMIANSMSLSLTSTALLTPPITIKFRCLKSTKSPILSVSQSYAARQRFREDILPHFMYELTEWGEPSKPGYLRAKREDSET